MEEGAGQASGEAHGRGFTGLGEQGNNFRFQSIVSPEWEVPARMLARVLPWEGH